VSGAAPYLRVATKIRKLGRELNTGIAAERSSYKKSVLNFILLIFYD
jgi:hypothetical protein